MRTSFRFFGQQTHLLFIHIAARGNVPSFKVASGSARLCVPVEDINVTKEIRRHKSEHVIAQKLENHEGNSLLSLCLPVMRPASAHKGPVLR